MKKSLIIGSLILGIGGLGYFLFRKPTTATAGGALPSGSGSGTGSAGSTTGGTTTLSPGGVTIGGTTTNTNTKPTDPLISAGIGLGGSILNSLFGVQNPQNTVNLSSTDANPFAIADNSQASIDNTFAPYDTGTSLTDPTSTDPTTGNLINDYSVNTADNISLTGA